MAKFNPKPKKAPKTADFCSQLKQFRDRDMSSEKREHKVFAWEAAVTKAPPGRKPKGEPVQKSRPDLGELREEIHKEMAPFRKV